jgi:hypothetical protein
MFSNPDFPAFNQALNASLNGNATGFAYNPIFDLRETVLVPCNSFITDIEGSPKTRRANGPDWIRTVNCRPATQAAGSELLVSIL